MKRGLFAVLFFFLLADHQAQVTDRTILLLSKLDSIQNSPSVSRHFAGIYFETTAGAIQFFSKKDERTQHLLERLESRFAEYFFRSADAHLQQQPVPDVWKAYYSDRDAPSVRYILYGINAHINGDIWQALTTEFSANEVAELKPHYYSYYKGLLKDYKRIYQAALDSNRKMRTIHHASLGLDKLYGKLLLARWRKRQMRLAELFFSDRASFEKRLAKLHRRMNNLNRLIRKNI